ncbi:iron-containing alcohol dehydrogenase [Actinoalloteichus sp. AHMU CJ021]|uniref:iron-containing alcohol dehydrogenase n=1 Tax=Actinoalloteichus TaxID=65496 RepID=UPI0003726292|nr:iron-containing alcohol dehydrogenase [Actinoalloteichus spitiensis]AUS80765.1 iron-containing alcohol dehydrogenase [Actinoalloteichus sp. AHMU CJ021]
MLTFDHLVPTSVAFGRGRLAELGEITSAHGRQALLVCGRTAMRRHGVLDRALHSLTSAGVSVVLFDGVSPNPLAAEVDAAARLARREKCEVVVGLGGGSALDAAKAAAVTVPHTSVRPLIGSVLPRTPGSLPVVAVPTTAGSGSEVTKGAIITDEAVSFRSGVRGDDLFPVSAIVDPDLLVSAPTAVVADSGFDALAHAVESYVARRANPISDRFAEAAVELITEHLPRAVAGETGPEVREGLALASLLGGCNVATASTCLPHRLQQGMGAVPRVDISHGRGLACVYPAWMERAYSHAPERFDRLARFVAADSVPDAVGELTRRIGISSRLTDHGFRKSDLDSLVSGVSGNLANDPIDRPDATLVEELYAASL